MTENTDEKTFEEWIKQFKGIGGVYYQKPELRDRDKRAFLAGRQSMREELKCFKRK